MRADSYKHRKFIEYGVLALLVGMPFHALVVITKGHLLGGQMVWQSWKEVLSILLCGIALFLFLREKKPSQKTILLQPANIAALSIISGGFAITLALQVDPVQSLYGYKVVLMPLVLFLIVQMARVHFSDGLLTKIVLWPSYAVAILALLQEFFIPISWWSAIGYGENTIRPLQLVDPAVKSIRAFASLGGPNQLGAYLILPFSLSLVQFFRTRKLIYGVGTLLTLGGVIVSFSRSAWLGLLVAVFACVVIFGNKLIRMITASVLALVVASFLIFAASIPARLQNTQLQYFLLHGRYNEAQQIEGSDYGRINALESGVTSIKEHPWGNGLGTAGPASFRSDTPVITENWYLQIAIEIGLIGLVLFGVFFIDNIRYLLRLDSVFAKVLSASILGLLVTNLFLHAWADSTLGIMLFTLMGLMRTRKS